MQRNIIYLQQFICLAEMQIICNSDNPVLDNTNQTSGISFMSLVNHLLKKKIERVREALKILSSKNLLKQIF